jgi:hypothetical protein
VLTQSRAAFSCLASTSTITITKATTP